MELELWSSSEDENGFIVDEFNVKKRVYLDNHTLLEGIDVTEIQTLNTIYAKKLLKDMKKLDSKEVLFNVSRGWFNLIPYINRYINLHDCIVLNHNNNKLESLIEKYSDSAERYIESYTDDGDPVILGEFEFDMHRRLNLEEGFAIKVETYKEEHLYKIKESNSYLFIKSDLNTGIKKGIILGKSAGCSLMENDII